MYTFDDLVGDLQRFHEARLNQAATPMAKAQPAAYRPIWAFSPSPSRLRPTLRSSSKAAKRDIAAVAAESAALLKSMRLDSFSDPAVRAGMRLTIGVTLQAADRDLAAGRISADRCAEVWRRGQAARANLATIERQLGGGR